MEHLAERDNNFYRVMMQADPITSAERFSGLERHTGYEALSSMADNQLVGNLLTVSTCLSGKSSTEQVV